MTKPPPALNVPPCLQELDIDPSIMTEVRKEALQLLEKDVVSFRTLSPEEKAARRRRVRLANPWGNWPIFAWCLAILMSFGFFMMVLSTGFNLMLAFGLQTVILIASIVVMRRCFSKRQLIPYFSAALRRHGIVVCPGCGYHVAHHPSEVICPECGLADPLPR